MKKALIIIFGLYSLFVFGQCPVIITDTQVACEGYTWSDGNSYNSQNYLPITTVGEQTPSLFSTTPNETWTNVFTSCIIGDGNNGETQTFMINVIELPMSGASYRVVKTVADGNFYNGESQPLVLGLNEINVAEPENPWGDRTVRFQFSSENVKFIELTSNGNILYEGASQTLINSSGCDTLVVLDLTFEGTPAPSTEIVSVCDSYTWSNGITYTESNYLSTTTINAQTPDLFANGPNDSWTNVYTACVIGDGNNGAQQTLNVNVSSLPEEGVNYRVVKTVANGNYNFGDVQPLSLGNNTINVVAPENPWGDRVVKFQFSNGNVEFTELSLNGNLDYSGVPSQVFTTSSGCDSTVSLDLSFSASSSAVDIIEACDSYTWIDGNTYNSSNNLATHTLINTAGCDSVITLDLTINESSAGTDTQQAAYSYTWIDGITYTSSNNIATFTLINSNNCDSVVTLDLTIENSSEINILDNLFGVQLFPNPASNFLTISLEGIDAVDIVLFNIQGKVLLEKKNLFDKESINISKYASGTYFMKILTPKGCEEIRITKN